MHISLWNKPKCSFIQTLKTTLCPLKYTYSIFNKHLKYAISNPFGIRLIKSIFCWKTFKVLRIYKDLTLCFSRSLKINHDLLRIKLLKIKGRFFNKLKLGLAFKHSPAPAYHEHNPITLIQSTWTQSWNPSLLTLIPIPIPIPINASFDQLLESISTDSDQNDFIQRTLHVAPTVNALFHSQCTRLASSSWSHNQGFSVY